MIYEYETYFVVQFSNKTRARYSKNKYGSLINKIVSLSESLDKKIYNYYENLKNKLKQLEKKASLNSINIKQKEKQMAPNPNAKIAGSADLAG